MANLLDVFISNTGIAAGRKCAHTGPQAGAHDNADRASDDTDDAANHRPNAGAQRSRAIDGFIVEVPSLRISPDDDRVPKIKPLFSPVSLPCFLYY